MNTKKAFFLFPLLLVFLGTTAFAGGAPLPPPAPSPTPQSQDVQLPQAVLDAIGGVLAALSVTLQSVSQDMIEEQEQINQWGIEIAGMITTVQNLRTQPMETAEQRQAIAVQLQPIIQRISQINVELSAIVSAQSQRRAILSQMITVLIQLGNLIGAAS